MVEKQTNKLVFLLPVAAFFLFAVIVTIALFGTLSGTRNTDQLPSVLIGKPAPPLPITPLNDTLAKPLQEFQGRPVLINFMASWCAPCRAELPALALLGKEVDVIAIAYKDKNQDTEAFLQTYGNPYDAVWMDYDGVVGRSFGLYGVPETFLLDGDGKIVMRHAGPVFKDVISDVIRPALAALGPARTDKANAK